MIIQNPLLTGSLNYNGADLSNVTSSNANSASVSLILTAVSSSNQQLSASYIALSASYNVFSGSASTRITTVSASQQDISSSLLQVSASYIALSGSYNIFSGSASTRVTQIENTYATTGSNSFRADQSITGSLVVSSTITAQTLVVQTVTSSIVYSSGSNLFGNQLANTQTFTGSVNITGSQTVFGNVGIGTTQPGYTLDVSGTGRFTGQLIASSTSGATAAIFQNTGVQNSNGIELRGGTTGTAVNWKLEKDNTVSNAFQLTPSTTNGGSTYTTPALTITSTGAATFSGNGAFSGVLQVAPTQGTGIIGVGDSFGGGMNAGIYRGGAGVTTTGNYLNIGGYDGVVVTTGAAALGSQTVRLTIASTGTATFSNRVIASNNAAGVATISTSNANNTDDAGVSNLNFDGNRLRLGVLPSDGAYGCIAASGAVNTGIAFVTHNGSGWGERMRILSTGNVGIGMTTAPSKLSVDGALYINGAITNVGTGTGTYTQTVWYVDTGNQILFESGRSTDSSSGTGRTVYFTWRGGPGVGGGVQLQHGANAWAAYTSDARMKTKVADVVNGLDAIMKLSPIKFKWTRELENSRTVTGFTAQNIGEAIPDAIFNSWKDDELGDVKSYFQDYLVPYLVKAIQELKVTNDNLQAQINELKAI